MARFVRLGLLQIRVDQFLLQHLRVTLLELLLVDIRALALVLLK